MDTPLLIDLAFVAVVALFAWLGARKGFVMTLCSLLSLAVAFAGAAAISSAAAPYVAGALQPRIEQVITQQLAEAAAHAGSAAPDAGAAGPDGGVSASGVLEVLRESGLYQGLMEGVEQSLNASAASAGAQVAAALAGRLARGILFAVSFVLLLSLWGIVSHGLDLMSRLPVINTLNRTLGGVLGGVNGLAVALLLLWGVFTFTSVLSRSELEATRVVSPLLSLLRSI